MVIVQDSSDTTPTPTTVRPELVPRYDFSDSYLIMRSGRYSISASSIMFVVTFIVLNKFYKRVKQVAADVEEVVAPALD